MAEGVRVDKWLWAVRVFRSRSASNEACSTNRVRVNDEVAKPATKIRVGDVVEVKRSDRLVRYRVVEALTKRVGAPLAAAAVDDLSPPIASRGDGPDEAVAGRRDRGAGRPTKRDRRRIEHLRGRS